VSFALVGPGDIHEELRAEVSRRGLDGVVELPGRGGDDLVRAYLSTADVCVNTAQPNPMNDRAAMRKVLEYLAVGRAVVQFPLAEMRRLCGDTTLYARPGDAHDLADRIAELLDDPALRDRLGAAGRARVHDGLMWSHQVAALQAALELACTRGRGRGRLS
jgi:glycosyltransferase involved in cell wall biosynthesis